jgi:hypothetical protein
MNSTIISALVRHILTAVGGAFAAKYAIDGASIEAVSGAVATLAGVAWSVYDKRK